MHTTLRQEPIARRLGLIATFALLAMLVVAPASAGNRGKGHGAIAATTARCWVEGSVVHVVDLPSDELINFMVTDASGTNGWVLGTSSWWNVDVPEREGPTTYAFVSRTWGKDGSKYKTFTACSSS
ncbi:MAG: hypothetical protein OEO77_09545 [Acidimicrobiia bacterium]|nr:hypothetical protein [Acidimicrobiia bacterium]